MRNVFGSADALEGGGDEGEPFFEAFGEVFVGGGVDAVEAALVVELLVAAMDCGQSFDRLIEVGAGAVGVVR